MIKAYRHTGEPIKAIDGNRVSGYLVRFTSKDDPDLHGEYFTKDTNFWLKELSPIGRPIFLDHAFDGKFKSIPVGIIDFLREDEIGIWIEGKLKERAEYEDMLRGWKDRKWLPDSQLSDSEIPMLASNLEKAVKSFFSTGKAQWSSGALPQSVEVADDGHIESWALIEGTGVHTPAEPDGTEIKLKSALNQMSELLNSLPPATQDAAIDAQHKEPTTENAVSNNKSKSTNLKQGLKDMELWTQLLELIAKLGASLGYTGEGEADAMASAVVDELKADSETPSEEELIKMDEEEVAKASDKLAEKAIKRFNAIVAKKKAQENAVSKAFDNHIKQAERRELPVDPYGAGGSNIGNPRKTHQQNIVVSESRKYAHLNAQEMALAAKIMQSAVRAGKANKRVDGDTLIEEGLASEDFIRTMAGKVSAELKRYNGSDRTDSLSQQDYTALKSIKADELNSSSIAAQGGDWVSIYYDPAAWERAREVTDLFNLLTSRGMVVRDIPQGAESVEFKIDLTSPTVYTRNQARSTDATGRPEVTARITPIGTDKVNVTPAEHVLATSNTDILNEDSIINMVAYLNSDIQRTLAEALEDSLINGDIETAASTNINLIDGTPGTGLSKPLYLAYDGFRKHALVTHSGQSNDVNAALSIDDFFDTIAEYDDNAIESRTEELLYIVDKDTHRAARKLPELLTPGVAMEGATIYVGKMPDIDGVPIYRSGFLTKSNTAGKISATPSNNVYGQILSVYPYYWGYARKRAITIETDRDIMAGVTVFVASMRHALLARSAKASTISYRITV